jgi:RNA polymerase sigma-70 factor (ECF subfamily)
MDGTDNELVIRARNGDTEAARTIIERHKRRIFYLGRRFFHNDEDAEDFSQEVFLRAFEKLRSFKGVVPFGAWLYRIAFNTAVNKYHYDRTRLTEIAEPDLSTLSVDSEKGDVADGIVRSDLKARVNEALKRLPDAYAIAIRMHFYDDLTYAEISDITGVPVNTIKSHIARAKTVLRPIIGPHM